MGLAESIHASLLLDSAGARTRDQAVDAILVELAAGNHIPIELVEELRNSIAGRDQLGPTGIGEGVAIPHAWHRGLNRMAVALGVSREGLDYPSLDGGRVHIVLLVLTPPSLAFEPAKAETFELWIRHLREPAFRASLSLAATPEELQRAIRAADHSLS
jgi:mannitol/fructose-specific phosphotransferase system IIA component (Ntr-type)